MRQILPHLPFANIQLISKIPRTRKPRMLSFLWEGGHFLSQLMASSDGPVQPTVAMEEVPCGQEETQGDQVPPSVWPPVKESRSHITIVDPLNPVPAWHTSAELGWYVTYIEILKTGVGYGYSVTWAREIMRKDREGRVQFHTKSFSERTVWIANVPQGWKVSSVGVSMHGPRIHIHWWNMGPSDMTDLRDALPSSSEENGDPAGDSPLPKRPLSPTRDRKSTEMAEKRARLLEAERKEIAKPRGG